jgi:hypothetical protein
MHTHLALLFFIITIDPFTKWGVDFMTCHMPLTKGRRYIIVCVNYLTKWAEAMPTFSSNGETAVLFIFNQFITQFSVPK